MVTQPKSKVLIFTSPRLTHTLTSNQGKWSTDHLMEPLCIKRGFYCHVWPLCSAAPFSPLQYQRQLFACCPAETEMTERGYSLKIFLSDAPLLRWWFILRVCVQPIACDGVLLLIISASVTQGRDLFFSRLTHAWHFDHHLNNCPYLNNLFKERKGRSFRHSHSVFTFSSAPLLSIQLWQQPFLLTVTYILWLWHYFNTGI